MSSQVYHHWVDGAAAKSSSEDLLVVINPSTGKPLLRIPVGCRADVGVAVQSSRGAFADGRWQRKSPSARKAILHRWADLIAVEAQELNALDAGEMGKPVQEATFSAASAAELARFHAESVDKLMGDALPSDSRSFVVQQRVPRGVVAAITPWNFPTFNAVLKTAPALAAGNSVVLKPSELSSRSALRLAALALQAGVPPGVLNVVLGKGEVVGEALGLHPEVDMIAFTGSTAVGKLMLQYAGRSNMKVVLAECGGKSPHIVFDDGLDLDAMADAIAGGLVLNQGQLCSVGSRLLVQEGIETELIDKIVERLNTVVVGDATDPLTTFGPLASKGQYVRVMEYITSAPAEGARLISGGRRLLQEAGGYFVEPTIFSVQSHRGRLCQEEIFGPVLSVLSFRTEEDAIRLANETIYGLMAYVWTSSLSTGLRMAKGVRSPVMVNASAPAGEGPGHAFSAEPARQSGIGVEGGLRGLESYCWKKTMWFNHV
jgi:acyl-CoA reductase-like NAD-dependent aldehyde dehydrogenase